MKKAINTFFLSAMALTCLAGTSQMPPRTVMIRTAATAHASQDQAEEFSFDGVNYQVLSNTARTCCTKPMDGMYSGNKVSGDIVIPEKVTRDGVEYTVTAVGNGSFYGNSDLRSIILPATVRSIGNEAFSQCTKLTAITIPEGVETIGDYAFLRSKLTSVTIPASLSYMGCNPFNNCNALTEISVAPENTVFAFADGILFSRDTDGNLTGVVAGMIGLQGDLTIPGTVTSIGASAFSSCSQLTAVILPENLQSIGKKAFYYCMKLSSADIPGSVTEIGESAFGYCSRLASVNIQGRITSLEKGVFENCSLLEHVSIPGTVTSIGEAAFSGCSALTDIRLPDLLTSIGYKAFTKCAFTSFTFPETVTEIGAYALSGCPALSSVTLPSSFSSIPAGLFNGCNALQSFIIPENVVTVGDYAFSSCTALKDIVLPKALTEIGKGVFMNCPALEKMDIPDGIISVGDDAFARCTGIKSLTLGNRLEVIGTRAFTGLSGLTSLRLPDSLKTLGNSAFSSCDALTDLDLGQSVTTIGSFAFYSCTSLPAVTIPASVTSIDEKAFYHCYSLTDVYVLNTAPLEIQENVFNCDPYKKYAQNYIYRHATLHVPPVALETYRQTSPWSLFSAFETLPSVTLAEIPAVVYGTGAIDLSDFADTDADLIYKSSDAEVAVIEGNLLTVTGAGEVDVIAERGPGMPVYMLIDNPRRSLTIDKADLTATAKSYTVSQNAEMPEFELEFTGFVYADTEADIQQFPTITCPVSDTAVPGTYPLTPVGGYARNYNIINRDGLLTITSRVGVENVGNENISIKAHAGEIIISGLTQTTTVEIYNASGNIISRLTAADGTLSYIPTDHGMYIIKIGNILRKVIL